MEMIWHPPETAPINGTMILGDFRLPWPIPAVWDSYDEVWCGVVVQASLMYNGKYNYWLQTEIEGKHKLKRWTHLPSLPKEEK